ncbi:MAG: SpoIVB peptidase [Ruminococcaceae bacterium]|nr:SpoIVB peptidase [Oscillospiraceae bacterium]
MEKFKNKNRLLALAAAFLLVISLPITAAAEGSEEIELIPGGMAFGIKFHVKGAIVLGTTGVETETGMASPAKDAGLMAGDVIIRAGGSEFDSAEALTDMISGSGGNPISIAFVRGGEEHTVNCTPARDIANGCYRIGVMVRDSTAGIGTVTFIDPQTNDFGGLGHGIYESDTGVLLPLKRADVVDVTIESVEKSVRNDPGELKGIFGRASIGYLWDNCETGVFGRLSEIPDTSFEPMPIAKRNDISEGAATILTTLSEGGIAEYDIEIIQIYAASGSTKNFLIRVCDNELIEKTGGIVQGMSGSPIIQNGKLVGAVTHVLINDPICGYGIFIENMLDSAFDVGVEYTSTLIAA